jgi:hypothetical protein
MFVVNILYIHSIVYVLLDPCLTTNRITEWKRSVSYSDSSDMCDSFLWVGWYVVSSNGGSMKLERQIKFFKSKTTKGSKQDNILSYLLISILDMLCHI